MKTSNKIFFLISLSSLTSSCAINYRMPTNRFETPETIGEKNKRAQASLGRGENVELTPDYVYSWASTTNPSLNSDGFYSVGAKYGALSNADLGLKYVTGEGLVASGKWQFAGTAKDKGFKSALMLNGAIGTQDKSTTSPSNAKADLSHSTVGLDLILGYRTGRSFLFYLSGFYDRTSYQLKQTRGTVERTFDGDSKNVGATAGFEVQISDKADVIVEYARSKTTAGQSSDYTDAIGGGLGIDF